MRIKSFSQFNEGIGSGYEDPGDNDYSFLEHYESEIQELEYVIFPKIGHEKDEKFYENFWDLLQNKTRMIDEIEKELQDLTHSLYIHMYVEEFDEEHDTYVFTEEYRKVIDSSPNVGLPHSTKRNNNIVKILIINIFTKNAEQYWAIYKKFIDKLHNSRGHIASKNFGM